MAILSIRAAIQTRIDRLPNFKPCASPRESSEEPFPEILLPTSLYVSRQIHTIYNVEMASYFPRSRSTEPCDECIKLLLKKKRKKNRSTLIKSLKIYNSLKICFQPFLPEGC